MLIKLLSAGVKDPVISGKASNCSIDQVKVSPATYPNPISFTYTSNIEALLKVAPKVAPLPAPV